MNIAGRFGPVGGAVDGRPDVVDGGGEPARLARRGVQAEGRLAHPAPLVALVGASSRWASASVWLSVTDSRSREASPVR